MPQEIGLGLPLILAAAFGAGFIDSMVGGGGLIQLPALFGAYPATAPATLLGTNKAASLLGTITAVARYARSVRIPWRALMPLLGLSILLAPAGALTATLIPPDVLRPLVPVILAAILIHLLRRKDFGTLHQPRAIEGRHRSAAWALVGSLPSMRAFSGRARAVFSCSCSSAFSATTFCTRRQAHVS